MAAGRLAAEIVVERDRPVHLGAGQVQALGDHRHDRLVHVAEGALHGVQDRQGGAVEPGMLLDDLRGPDRVPALVTHPDLRFLLLSWTLA